MVRANEAQELLSWDIEHFPPITSAICVVYGTPISSRWSSHKLSVIPVYFLPAPCARISQMTSLGSLSRVALLKQGWTEHFHFSFPLRWNSRKQQSIRGKTNTCHFFSDPSVWHWCSVSRANSLSPVCLPPANTKTIVFGCVWSILTTSHLSFTSVPACPFSSVKGGSFFLLWTALIFPRQWTNMWLSNLYKRQTT